MVSKRDNEQEKETEIVDNFLTHSLLLFLVRGRDRERKRRRKT